MQKNKFLFQKVWSFLFERKDEFIQPDADVKAVIERLYDLTRAKDFDSEEALQRLKQKLQAKKQRRIRLYRNVASYAGLAVIATLSVWFYFYKIEYLNISNKQQLIIVAENTSKNIRLTLGGGNVVTLPEKGSATLIQNDSLAIENDGDASLSYQGQYSEKALEYNTLDIPRTKNYRLTLSDGTSVYLNSDTRIRFPKAFSKKERKIFLEKGEAYFEVAHNAHSPFIVETSGTEIKVLGTIFNIAAYPEANVATTLVSGKVEVIAANQTVTLAPGQQAVAKNDVLAVAKVDLTPYTSWKNGLFIFKRQTLDQVMMQMHRWYDFSLVFVDAELKNYRLTGAIDRNLSEQEVFNILERTNNIKIEMDGRVVRVRKKK